MTVPLLDSASSVTNVPNHQGYGRLQELLAGVGIVSVSVSTNAANFFNANIEMRAQTVIAAMNHLKKLAADAASPYFGRLDLKRVGLMGHSRGGDVVVSVAKKLQGSADFTVQRPVPFRSASSTISSTRGLPVLASVWRSTSAVISMRKLSRSPLFHSANTSAISGAVLPRPSRSN